jgi:hypothetical protein
MTRVERDFKDISPYKDAIERILYALADMISHIQIVAGPDVERHICNAREYVARTHRAIIQIVEYDWDVHMKQLGWMREQENIQCCPTYATWQKTDGKWRQDGPVIDIKHNVKFSNEDIAWITPVTRFIDADLMGTITGKTGDAIKLVFNRQVATYSDELGIKLKKAFIFTFCVRGTEANEIKTLNWISSLINKHLESNIKILDRKSRLHNDNCRIITTGWKGVCWYTYNIDLSDPGRVIDCDMHFYNEKGNNMITGIVIYK